MHTINTRIITIGMTIVMKCAFYRPSSHVTCALNQNMAPLQVHHLVPPNIPTRKFTLKQHTLFQKVLFVNQKVDSVTALRHRIAIIPIHTFSAPLLGPNYKPQTEKGDPRKSLN